MDVIGSVIFLGIIIAKLISQDTNSYGFVGASIGLGLCAIALAISNYKRDR